ncbi:MAG: hypothetical protein IJW26_01585 [Clostridia bacterium]|nr:hypothetical protein [Clostridia bacterium]
MIGVEKIVKMKRKLLLILAIIISFSCIGCSKKEKQGRILAEIEFSQYSDGACDVAVVVGSKVYIGNSEIDLQDIAEKNLNGRSITVGKCVVMKESVVFSVSKQNVENDYAVAFLRCDFSGKQVEKIYEQSNMATYPHVVVIDSIFYIEHFSKLFDKKNTRIIDSYDLEKNKYSTNIENGQELSFYQNLNSQIVEDNLKYDCKKQTNENDKSKTPRYFFQIVDKLTNNEKYVNDAFWEKTCFWESLNKFDFYAERIDESCGRVFLTYSLHLAKGFYISAIHSYLIFEFDFNKETVQYKGLFFMENDDFAEIRYIE